MNHFEIIFITNPTCLHFETLLRTKHKGKHFFIEKPVFLNGKENLTALELNKDSIYYVACPLRYMNAIQYIKQNVDIKKVHSVRSISSSYLPDWRPNTDYRKAYCSKKEMGGGVSADLVHEWDYLRFLFGTPRKIYSIIEKKSQLCINSDDLAIYIAEYTDKCIELHLDYFGRTSIRKLELFTEDETIEIDLINQIIRYSTSNKIINLYEDRNSYQKKEILHFFDMIEGKSQNDNTIMNACQTLRIARGENV